jgi:ABC-type polysaccharide/polyol phosphate export permease
MSRVTRGKNVVDTMTWPGYSNLVAVTSIWQLLEHEIDGGGVDVALVVGVCMIVVGTIRVVINDCVMRIVETDVVVDRVSVNIEVGPAKDMVLSTVDAGCVMVDIKFVVNVLAGNSLRMVVVVGGIVIVDRIVLGGS